LEVRYTVNTNVVITALKAADPQSQDAQARTRPLLVAWFPDSSSEDGCVAPGALALFIRCIVSALGEHPADLIPATPGKAAGGYNTHGGSGSRALINWALPNLTHDRQLQLLTIESLTLRRYQ
jgi:hypothetical protein